MAKNSMTYLIDGPIVGKASAGTDKVYRDDGSWDDRMPTADRREISPVKKIELT